MKKLVLLRHGESQWNLENRFTGWTDVDLTNKGQNEAREAGILLKDNQFKFDVVYTSYLKRSIDTSKICLSALKNDEVKVISEWRLNERHYGNLQGLNKSETARKYGEEQVLIWRRSYDTPPPAMDKGDQRHPSKDPIYSGINPNLLPSSESLKDTLKRVKPILNDNIIPEIKDGKNIMIVAHGNSLRAVIKILKNISDEDIINLNIPTGVPLIIEIDEKFRVSEDYYLGNIKEIQSRAERMKAQGKFLN